MHHTSLAKLVLAAGMGAACLVALPAHGQTGSAPAPHRTLGTVNFPVTCSPAAQAEFNHAMLLQHSFWYQVAGESFRQVRQ